MNRKAFLALIAGALAALVGKLPRAATVNPPKTIGRLHLCKNPSCPSHGYAFVRKLV